MAGYTKTIWSTGDVITASLMNNAEKGTEKNDVQTRESQIENIGVGVQSGLNVLDSSVPDMNVHVQTGTIYIPDGARYEFTTIKTIAVNTADATYARKDIIYVDSSGVIQYSAGTPASSPSEPSLPSGAHKLCVIDVPAGDTAIDQTQITDTRTMKKPVSYKEDLDAHLADSTDAHDASAISVVDSGANFTATNVEDALAEEADARQAHESASDPHSNVGFLKASSSEIKDIELNIIDMAIELETLKGATLNGVTANILVETFKTITDVTLSNGLHDSTNEKVYIA